MAFFLVRESRFLIQGFENLKTLSVASKTATFFPSFMNEGLLGI